MNQVFFFFFMFFFELIYSSRANAQAYLTDTAFYRQSVDHAIDLYMNRLGENSNLYNGSEYIYSYHGVKGFPFFESEQLLNGDINYDGTLYKNIPMSYDIVRDEVLIKDGAQNFNIKLVVEKIRFFSISGRVFVRLHQDSSDNAFLPTGFYNLVYKGKISVLVRFTKKMESVSAEEPFKFVQYSSYWVKKYARYERVENKKTLLRLFSDQKNAVRKFLRKNKINFKRDPANAIMQAAAYYDSLKN